MEDSTLSSSKLLENFFRDFYYELLKCKELALRTTRLDAELSSHDVSFEQNVESGQDNDNNGDKKASSDTAAANANQHPLSAHEINGVPVHAAKTADEIQVKLKKILSDQTSKIVHLLDQTDSLQFKDAQYAMIALADEVFLTLTWSGKRLWQAYLLESQIFQSQSSGTQIFQKIDDLLTRYDPSKKSLAIVYFHILSLGFKGKFYNSENQQIIKSYERRLYAFINGKNPSLSAYGLSKLMPECYEYTITSDASTKLPDVKFWTTVVASMTFIFLFASYMLWHSVAADLYKSLNNIFEQFQIFLADSQ
ncbi:MAG: DotU family type IV/VI secretion system protein [Holosporales bacterium]|jgi:type IV/VI secretion system ImpK/VasF family protein|nr:DotU family type IV/VI secretion system protein [Holosporales bacterium]